MFVNHFHCTSVDNLGVPNTYSLLTTLLRQLLYFFKKPEALVRPNYNRGIAKTEGIKLTQNNK